MTHMFVVYVVAAPNKIQVRGARLQQIYSCAICSSVLVMPNSRENEPILPTTNMAQGNVEKKKRVLVVGAGAAGKPKTPFDPIFILR